MKLLGFERRWVKSLLSAFAPPSNATEAAIDYEGAFEQLLEASTRRAAIGIRFALWFVVFAPVWRLQRLGIATTLGLARRVELLQQLMSDRRYVVRELTLLLKVAASLALLGDPAVRARTGYDRPAHVSEPPPAPHVPALTGDIRGQRRLPLLSDTSSKEPSR